jgi:hypothetical protein
MSIAFSNPRVLGRDSNVVRVDFHRDPEPPLPRFPGGGALRDVVFQSPVEAVSTAILETRAA